MLRRGSLLGFVIKAIIALIVVAICWYYIAPAYNKLLTVVSTVFLPGDAVLESVKNNIYIYNPSVQMVGGIHVLSLHYGLVVVMVLAAATPGLKIIPRLRSLGIALLAVFFLNVLSIVIFAGAALSGNTGSAMENPVIVLFAILGSDLFPVAIWASLSYKYFFLQKPKRKLQLAETRA